jgi:glycosyltransferase involved in cell wall biosynthesis
MPNAGILALVPDDWSDPWQRRHHILTRLAASFLVAWVSPPLHWRAWLHRSQEPRGSVPNEERMRVLASRDGLPTATHPRRLAEAIYQRRVLRGRRWLQRRGCGVIELQLWRPEYAAALDWVPYDTCSYHIDDEYSWSSDEQPMSPVERRLIERSDRVFVTSPKLLETKGGISRDTRFSPNGVDFDAFSTATPEPEDLARVPHPRIGYVGVLKEQLDWELLATLAASRPEWAFVLIGPVRTGHEAVRQPLSALARLPNVHVLGERSAARLPGYLQHLDVALLPYRRNAYTDCINPLKLYEALAAGTAVVATRIRTLEDFAGVVTLAETEGGFAAAIAASLTNESPARKLERQNLAKTYDWDAIVQPIALSIAVALGVGESQGPPSILQRSAGEP